MEWDQYFLLDAGERILEDGSLEEGIVRIKIDVEDFVVVVLGLSDNEEVVSISQEGAWDDCDVGW